MAARRTRTKLDEAWRQKIQVSMLINRLHDNALGNIEMTKEQIKSAEILLRKVAPDLKAIDISGAVDNNLTIGIVKFGDIASAQPEDS